MSKNFELLHNLSNEKELFQTLDTGEEINEIPGDAEPDERVGGEPNGKNVWQPSLPDVFRAVNETLGPLGPSAPDFIPGSKLKREQEPVEEERENHRETPSRTSESRFPISRNPITPLNAAPAMPSWAELEEGPELGSEAELEIAPEILQSLATPEALPGTERIERPNGAAADEPHPGNEEKAQEEVQQKAAAFETPPLKTPATRVAESKATGRSHGRKLQAQRAYKDAKRGLIAREEEFKLVQRIFLGGEQDSPRIALFSGIEHARGSASICVRAGELLAAQEAGTVCIVDANFRAPSLHEYFGVQNDKGLAEAALEAGPIQGFAQQLSPANLWLVPGGYGASQLNFAKAADGLRARMEELRGAYRYVFVHSGPLWLNANAMLLSRWTDGVVLILEANSTRRDTARRLKESLAVANAKVLGIVLNNRSYPIPESLYSRL